MSSLVVKYTTLDLLKIFEAPFFRNIYAARNPLPCITT